MTAPVSRTGATDREVEAYDCTIDDCDICDPDPLTAERDDYGHTEADHEAAGACLRPSMEARAAAAPFAVLGKDWQRAWMVGYDAAHAAAAPDSELRTDVARRQYIAGALADALTEAAIADVPDEDVPDEVLSSLRAAGWDLVHTSDYSAALLAEQPGCGE